MSGELVLPSPLLAREGAVAGDGMDAGVAAHYGQPAREQRLLREGLACVDLSHRGVVTVSGPDRLSWLHSMTTQQLTGLGVRESTESLVLSPHGHIEHALHVVDDGERTWLWFMLRVDIADVSDAYAVVGEPVSRESEAGEPMAWVDRWPGLVGDTAAYGPVEGHPGADWAWREVIVPRAELDAVVGERPLAGMWALEALRVAAWRPRLGFETDHRTIPHELHKGCYRGQETVARVKNLGRPPRRLVFLHLDGSGHVLPEAGTPIEVGGRAVGRVTTVARHEQDGPIALAVVKRSLPVDLELQIPVGAGSAVSAAQTVIVEP